MGLVNCFMTVTHAAWTNRNTDREQRTKWTHNGHTANANMLQISMYWSRETIVVATVCL